eukprot:NODE_688_length_671_cov_333.840074_g679_i0.p1 GENE.NODE_688_length_671_cov_333.840074_g679_i0~~NODE_688_length_671_cov_333.840074_g679_i0.p1  ORF type:complete len:144 (-),score=51.10 NODE_688_length_671_cov_333.840074_g679_i0:240-623(-)
MASQEGEQQKEQPKNVVPVSIKRSFILYANVTKKILNEGFEEVEISGLGNAITATVSTVEVLKKQKMVEVTRTKTSLTSIETRNSRQATVPKLQVWVKKSADFDTIYAEQQAKRQANEAAGEDGDKA